MTDDPTQYAGTDEATGPAARPDHGGGGRPADVAEALERARRPGAGDRPHPPGPADQGLDPDRDRPRASGLFLPLEAALQAVIIVAAVVAVLVGTVSRLFIRIPPGAVGLGAQAPVIRPVPAARRPSGHPVLALTHVITTRELAFDVPVAGSARPTGSTSTSTSS